MRFQRLHQEAGEAPEGGGSQPAAEPPATPPTPAWHEGLVQADGSFAENWSDRLPPEMDEFKGIAKDAKSIRDLLHRTKTSQAAARDKAGLKPLGEGATDEAKAAWDVEFRKISGVPEKPEDYGLTVPEGVAIEPQTLAAFQAMGLNKSQAQGAVNYFAELMQEGNKSLAESDAARLTEARKGIDTTFGDKKDAAIALVTSTAKAIDPNWEQILNPESDSFGSDKAFILVHSLASEIQTLKLALAKATGGDPLPASGTVSSTPARDFAWAKAVRTGTHPDAKKLQFDAAAVAEVNRLYAEQYGGKK